MKLIAVTDDNHSIKELAEIIISIKDRIDYVQIREKSKSPQSIMTLLHELQVGGVRKEKLIINDRLDIALLKDIPNLHLPEAGIPVKLVKEHYPELKVGCSVHSLEKAKEIERDGADYALYGHCFETVSKKGVPPNGMENFIKIKQELKIPVYGIGGITLEKVALMKDVNAAGIAVMSGIFQESQPQEAVKKYCQQIIV